MYAVIGANGFLGNYIIKSILQLTDERVIGTARDISKVKDTDRISWVKCDITNENEFDDLVQILSQEETVKVVFLAAYHNPDKVAENPNVAWDINVTTLSKCVNNLYFVDKLYYASTDSVYGNSINGYHFVETDLTNPVNIYGRNKAAAEAIVVNYGFNVVRYPFLIAPSLVEGKPHFYDRMVESLKSGNEITMFSDSYRSSLNFKTAASLLVKLMQLEDDIPSILNICGDKDLSKYDIGLMIADSLNVSRELVKPITMETDSAIFKSARATSTLMDNTLVKRILGIDTIEFEI